MTIRTITNKNKNNKSFASSAPSTEEEIDAAAFNVNADVFNEGNISFAHAESVDLSGSGLIPTSTAGGYGQLNKSASATTTNAANNTAHQTTPIAYSTGKPQQPLQTQPRSSSSSVAVATGAPTSIPIPTSTTTQTTSTSTTTSTTRGNNSQCCIGTCTTVQRWICCGITSTVLFSIFLCCILPFILVAISIGSAANS
ncbi:hypothetical protein FRACYDRAFT_276621 [Fragilariopsis cylindrus CCMP1102]|uniref:Uncharacterized protein n=1 Tax=Fragilariopsis cylindrus CCMP1102 TaxID=635003 RepID=A0A1E7F458_9STRA|nr:hypothetical protein FRACYDRAFT_276621 [Fragilariopsis cylindrus CCMP1102]|eukprot:OEU12914.1 hypothetical protein FRACYDRAFT_276621 [Fragilariopsis cylindrus CCMP1102]